MKTLVVFVAALIAGGCAAPVNPTKPGGTTTDFNNDMSACEYDAVKYGSNTDPMMRTAIGAGIEQTMRQRDIKLACMKSKRWSPQ